MKNTTIQTMCGKVNIKQTDNITSIYTGGNIQKIKLEGFFKSRNLRCSVAGAVSKYSAPQHWFLFLQNSTIFTINKAAFVTYIRELWIRSYLIFIFAESGSRKIFEIEIPKSDQILVNLNLFATLMSFFFINK